MSNNKDKHKICYYAVRDGHNPGIYYTWNDCKVQVEKYENAKFKKFDTMEEAKEFITCTNPDKFKKIEGVKTNSQKYIKPYIGKIKSYAYMDSNNYTISKWNLYMDEFYLFTDGSSKKKGDKITHSGVGMYLGPECYNIKQIYKDKTNNQCELMAIYMAYSIILKNIKQLIKYNKKINIITDSEYSINCVTKWIKKWEKTKWITSNGTEVKNKELIISINDAMEKINKLNEQLPDSHKIKIKFLHVNSHTVPNESDKHKYFLWTGNLIADGLAQNLL
jgi:ribonuclease HI